MFLPASKGWGIKVLVKVGNSVKFFRIPSGFKRLFLKKLQNVGEIEQTNLKVGALGLHDEGQTDQSYFFFSQLRYLSENKIHGECTQNSQPVTF